MLAALARWLQILDIVQELNSRNALVCDMTMRSYFLNTTNLRIQLNKGDIPQAFTPSKWFHSDSVCFAASQCQACFLQESRDWLTENTHCNTDVNRCTVRGQPATSQLLACTLVRLPSSPACRARCRFRGCRVAHRATTAWPRRRLQSGA